MNKLSRGTVIITNLLLMLACFLSAPGCVVCWTYHASQHKMDWEEARIFCKTNYTDLVAIQNERETEHLLNIQDIVPHRDSSPHYWIGIRKINETWTWIGTNKKLTGYESWDTSEPNSRFPNEDCVEIYINQQIKKGKWNDMSCSQKNYAICYKAQCTNEACSNQGECVEMINSFQCQCRPGFNGPHCQTAVQCPKPTAPKNGWMECCGSGDPHFFGTTCKFGCQVGFRREGPAEIKCSVTGEWSELEPECLAVQCPKPTTPQNGWMECCGSGDPYFFGTTCKFGCQDGFRREGPAEINCNATGGWSEHEPECLETPCGVLREPAGGFMNCSWGNNTCTFQCQPGFLLLGSNEVTCGEKGLWRGFRPVCASHSHLLLAVLGWNVLLAACLLVYCCQKRRKKCPENGSKHDRLNPVYDATGSLEEPFSP